MSTAPRRARSRLARSRFHGQETLLCLCTPQRGIAPNPAVRPYDAVTGDDQGDWVGRHAASDGSPGPGRTCEGRELSISLCPAVGYLTALSEDPPLKIGKMVQIDRYITEVNRQAGGVGLQPPNQGFVPCAAPGATARKAQRPFGGFPGGMAEGKSFQHLAGTDQPHPAEIGRKDDEGIVLLRGGHRFLGEIRRAE